MADEPGEKIARLHQEIGESQRRHAVAEEGDGGGEGKRHAAGCVGGGEDPVGKIDAELATVAEPLRNIPFALAQQDEGARDAGEAEVLEQVLAGDARWGVRARRPAPAAGAGSPCSGSCGGDPGHRG